MSAPRDPQELAAGIDALLDDIAAHAGEPARAAAEELVRRLMQFYGAGLEQLMATLDAAGGPDLQRRVAANPLVGGLLALHDLHPVELATRLRYALDTARRRLGSHGVGIELTGVDGDGMVRVRIPGGCGVDTVRDVVEAAVAEAAPDTAGVVFDRAAAEPPLLQIGVRPHRRRSSGDPIPAALPARARRPAGAAAGAVRAVRDAGGRRASAPRRARGAAAAVRVHAVRGAVQRAGAEVSESAGPVPVRYRVRAVRRRSGTSCRSRSGWRSSSVNSIRRAVVACYPSPAGATESELSLAAWADGWRTSALAGLMEPDVEALLVRRGDAGRGGSRGLLVPVDACYRLVGLVRLHWKGFDGGAEAWAAIDAFFAELRRGGGPHGEHRPGRGGAVLRFSCAAARPEPYAAGPSAAARPRDQRGRAGARRRACGLPDPDRAAAAPLHGRGGGPAGRPVRRARPLGRARSTRCSSPPSP